MTPDSSTSPPDAAADAPGDNGEPAATDNGEHAAPRPRRGVAVLGDRVLVSVPADGERRSKGGILIPATAESVDKKGIWGETMAVGPHVRHIQTGDEVLYLPEDAIEVDVQGDSFLIVRERDVHAVASSRRDGATGLYL